MGKRPAAKKQSSLVTEPTVYFREEVTKALVNQKVTIDPNTEYYLVDLLMRFMTTDNLFACDEKGGKREEVLALLMGEALATTDVNVKQRSLRRLGDISLYTAGFFQDSLARKVVDVDYYIGMGRNAYSSLATTGLDVFFQKVFMELSQHFHRFVDVLGEVSESSGTKDPKNILRLYDLWLKTRSERAAKTLKEAGIIPNKLVRRDWQ